MSETPITPVIVGDAALAHEFSRQLFPLGVFAPGHRLPHRGQGQARIRTIVTATHTEAELTKALDIMGGVAKELKMI